jgi:16S rRNA (cytidine1402-2'-O)-methyltransferase
VGTLYLVATPIGNLQDISARALQVLNHVALIAAEDTRQTRKLLSHYQIHTPLISYHEHNKITRLGDILSALSSSDVAVVSDAGTPALNDPGYELVRVALDAGFPVSPIPGPSAPISALVASGLPTDAFLYLGYLPRKSSERKSLLRTVAGLPYTLIFLESPHRLIQALSDIQAVLGNRRIAVARELTKIYEEIYRGDMSDTISHFSSGPVLGEITLVISGSNEKIFWSEAQVQEALSAALSSGMSSSQAASAVAAQSGWPRRGLYRLIAEQKGSGEG